MKVVAKSRELQGTSASRRLRLAGKVPGIIYGGEAGAKSIEMEHNPLYHAMRVESFHSSILDVEVDGKSEQVLLRDVHWHPWKRQVMHVDFQRVQANEKITLSVPLHFINEDVSPAVKLEAAIISHVITELDIVCLPKDLPEYVEVDMSEMTTDHAVHVSDLKLPAGVETDYLEGADPVVATATVKAGADVEQEDGAPQAPAAPEVPGADDEAPKEEE